MYGLRGHPDQEAFRQNTPLTTKTPCHGWGMEARDTYIHTRRASPTSFGLVALSSLLKGDSSRALSVAFLVNPKSQASQVECGKEAGEVGAVGSGQENAADASTKHFAAARNTRSSNTYQTRTIGRKRLAGNPCSLEKSNPYAAMWQSRDYNTDAALVRGGYRDAGWRGNQPRAPHGISSIPSN